MDNIDSIPVVLVPDRADARALLTVTLDALESSDANNYDRGAFLSAACQLAQALRHKTPDRILPSCNTRAVDLRATRAPTAPPHGRTARDPGGGSALGAALFMAKVSRPVPRTAPRVAVPGWLLAELVDFALSHYEMDG